MIDKYLEAPVFQNLAVEEITILKKLASKASCPAFLYSCADILPDSDIASNISLMWSGFEEIDFDM